LTLQIENIGGKDEKEKKIAKIGFEKTNNLQLKRSQENLWREVFF
jgi:hypothetical protein